MMHSLAPDARALAVLMSTLSEQAYCAGWMNGLEYSLWRAVTTGSAAYGRIVISTDSLSELRRLSTACKGWVIFDSVTEKTWVAIDEWERRYQAWLEAANKVP